LHEGGHALVVLAYGGTIDNFILGLNAHVRYHGTNFTLFGEALFHVAGMLLPTITGAVAICFYKPKIRFIGYHICYTIGSVSLVFTMMVWVVIPVISLFTLPPQGDDVTKFLDAIGVNPLFVSFGALLLITAFVVLMYKKSLFLRIKEIVLFLRNRKISKKHILFAISIGVFIIAAAIPVFYNIAFRPVVLNASIVTDNVLQNPYQERTFTIEKNMTYTVQFAMRSQGSITALRIVDADGELVFQDLAEDFTNEFAIELEKGVYTLSLTYLYDYEAVTNFFDRTAQNNILIEWSDYYKEILQHDTNYSAWFTIKIR
jgi:hypothetical protein